MKMANEIVMKENISIKDLFYKKVVGMKNM